MNNGDLQRTDKWYADRLGMVTSSSFHKIMARHKRTGQPLTEYYTYLNDVVQEIMTGINIEIPDNEYMRWGRTYELVAISEYTLKTKNLIESLGFIRLEELPIGCSPDGKIVGAKGGIEVKCPTTKTHMATFDSGEVPERYIWQVHGQMWIMDWDFVDFVSYDPRIKNSDSRLVIIRVERDEAIRTKLATEVYEFVKLVRKKVKDMGGEIK